MIMGRKTFDSFPAPLPGRRHIVLTRDAGWRAKGAEVAHDPIAALALAGANDSGGEVMVIGGAQVYALFETRAHRFELTEVHADVPGEHHLAQAHGQAGGRGGQDTLQHQLALSRGHTTTTSPL